MTLRIGVQAFVIVVLLTIINSVSLASGVEWGGGYRFEFNHISNSELTGDKPLKEYMTHHMILRPKIVAADGLNIYGQFNIFNNSNRDQIGAPLGANYSLTPADLTTAPVTSQTTEAAAINVTQLYLTLNHEYGAFIAGRTPFHFGLGMTHNAGEGLFDHFYDTRDLVGYKMVFGNYYVMTSYAKLKVGEIGTTSSDINEFNIHVQYDKPETNMEMGILYSMRKASAGGNNLFPIIANPTDFASGGVNYSLLSFYMQRDFSQHRIGFETAITDGHIGGVDMKGYGLAVEYEYKPENKKWAFGTNLGMATGDDTSTTSAFENFRFDPNYNVALLLFNYPLGGTNNALQSGFYRDPAASAQLADVEGVSNSFYLAPYATYQWKKNWSVKTSLITGQIFETLTSGNASLGIEVDASLTYKPHEGFMWMNEFGYLTPGNALGGDGSAMALVSKIAISF